MTDTFQDIIRTLNRAGVRYMVVGPMAVVAHGCLPQTDNFELRLVTCTEDRQEIWRCVTNIGSRRSAKEAVPVESLDLLEFEEMYARSERFKLAPGIEVPVCGYGDLVKIKRRSGRPCDLVDLDQLEKVTRVRPAYDPWYACTFEGDELWSLWQWADLTPAEKVRSILECQKLGQTFQKARQKSYATP